MVKHSKAFNPPMRLGNGLLRTYASVGRRFAALLVDGLLPAVLVAVFILTGLLSGGLTGALVGYLIGGAALSLYGVLLWVMLAKWGTSPGKAALRIDVVHAPNGQPPGWGKALIRLVLRGILLTITVGIAGLSPYWDATLRRRAWWDTATDTLVLDRPRSAPQHLAPPVPAARSLSWQSVSAKKTAEDDAWAVASAAPGSTAGGPKSSSNGAVSAPPAGETSAVPGQEPLSPSELDRTIKSPRRKTSQSQIVLDTGEQISIGPVVLVGRDPAAAAEEGNRQLLVVKDNSRTVSKTHLLIEIVGGSVRVTDRHSTNGSGYIDAHGVLVAGEPGVPLDIPEGAAVTFGDRRLRVLVSGSQLPGSS